MPQVFQVNVKVGYIFFHVSILLSAKVFIFFL